jgi:hypothetical protein
VGTVEESAGKVSSDESSALPIRNLAAVLLLANLVSALLFIAFVNRLVFDDPNNLPDVVRYVRSGMSLESVRAHRNPTGPGSFIWMAEFARIAGTVTHFGMRGWQLASVGCCSV